MPYLIAVTLLWAFSFSLIGEYLAGQVDSYFAVLTRILLACLLFLPLLRPGRVPRGVTAGLLGIGALQFGVTYICLYLSFELLTVPEVLLFTIFTPLYIALLDNALRRQFSIGPVVATLLAVLGAGIIRYDGISDAYMKGFLLLQLANLAFAAGQVGYAHLILHNRVSSRQQWENFGLFFIGALLVALPAWLLLGNHERMPTTSLHWGVLGWLGLVASGLGFFFWNRGATQVDAGTLGIMNNALIPAGLLVNLLIWNQQADLLRLAIGGGVIGLSLWLNARWNDWSARLRKSASADR
ncbi:carboxylate/amino acid/amine transporter [Halopseudomonas pertucinogena]|uniref:Membrane protein n=1 Tax=Halopseudomonas pertucinogena TaxID=86175 RepID=A0ABQ2CR70_9GAMM|nr:carboxylate/amino acid/amine transporter [Halopseudomonas pertucinogena]GGJ05167.1 putative membrane protein [Halopseudomonas pertucinogena]